MGFMRVLCKFATEGYGRNSELTLCELVAIRLSKPSSSHTCKRHFLTVTMLVQDLYTQ